MHDSMTYPIQGLRVLIVDDTADSRQIAAAILRRQGVDQLFFATNGEEALHAALEHQPDLILLDVIMPGMDGYTVCRTLRQQPDFRETPIIVQTGIENMEGLAEIFAAGATDFIRKPLQAGELVARTTIHLQRVAMQRLLQDKQRQWQQELHTARAMQSLILPNSEQCAALEAAFQVELAVHHQPCQSLSGDLWGVKALSQTRMAFYQVDFTGHGILAALNSFRFHSLTQRELVPSDDPGAYLTALNHALYALLPRQHFATAWYGVLDTQAETLSYATAAHTQPLLLCNGAQPLALNGHGYPLGAVRNATYETITIDFPAQTTLLLYSDALIEGWSHGKEDALHRWCALESMQHSYAETNVKAFLHHLINHWITMPESQALSDDLSLLMLRRKTAAILCQKGG
jgi:sigma-B regulation protein RsbU (phosphoserine phosphatase)